MARELTLAAARRLAFPGMGKAGKRLDMALPRA